MKLLKKFLCTLLSAAMMTAAAASPSFAADDISITLDGRNLSFDVPPQIINERTMVPLRAIFEALGADVDWDQATQTVTSSKDDITIRLTEIKSSLYQAEKDSAMKVINSALKLYDTFIQDFNLGITLKDFGVLYD